MIPNVAHAVWFGHDLAWAHALTLRSAALAGGFERVVLHAADDISGSAGYPLLRATPGVEVRPLDPSRLLRSCGPLGPALVALFDRLDAPAARANMVRAALLFTRGGVYVDTDTITVASFEPLRTAGVFCGTERLALPVDVVRSRRPTVWLGAGLRLAARDLCRRLPHGWRLFRRLEGRFPVAANNAVLGAEAGHPFIDALLRRMVTMDPRRQLVRFALGTHLLAEQVAGANGTGADLVVHPPARFYPLGPEISEHWFRRVAQPDLDAVLHPETVLVHWYASVRTKHLLPRIDEAYVRAHAERELFSALAVRFL